MRHWWIQGLPGTPPSIQNVSFPCNFRENLTKLIGGYTTFGVGIPFWEGPKNIIKRNLAQGTLCKYITMKVPKINVEPGLDLLDRIGSDIVQSSLNELFRNDFVRLSKQKKHSSRMRTVRFSDSGGGSYGDPAAQRPSGERPSWTKAP